VLLSGVWSIDTLAVRRQRSSSTTVFGELENPVRILVKVAAVAAAATAAVMVAAPAANADIDLNVGSLANVHANGVIAVGVLENQIIGFSDPLDGIFG
jgi:hypothetical protein